MLEIGVINGLKLGIEFVPEIKLFVIDLLLIRFAYWYGEDEDE